MAWKRSKLTGLADFINGYAFKPADWGEDGLPIIRIEQLKDPKKIDDYYSGRLPAKNIIDDGDLIFSWSASLFLKIWEDGKAALNQHLFKVIERQGVSRPFLKYLIEYHLPELAKAAHGSTMQHITRKELDAFEADYPDDIGEQKGIEEILFSVDEVVTLTKALIAKQEHIKTGLMHDLLTRGIDENGRIRSEETHRFKDSPLGRIPAEWKVDELRTVATIIDPNPSHRYPPASHEGIPIVSTENFFGPDGYDLSFAESVPLSVYEKQNSRCDFQESDVVFARKGRLGFARRLGRDKKVFSHTVVIIKPSDDRIQPDFLLWLLRDRNFFVEIEKRMNSNSGVPTLGVEFLGAVPVRIPPVSEQKKISEVLDACSGEIAVANNDLEKLLRLKRGLMHDLLTGKLRVPIMGDPRQVVGAVA